MRYEIEEKLYNCSTLYEFLTMFFSLGSIEKKSLFDESITIPEGALFYRIRRAESFTLSNYDDPKEWGPVPKEKARRGRFNAENESVLYVATDSWILPREVRLEENEEYYLAHYRCKQTFSVGSFFKLNSRVNSLLHKVAMSLSNENDLFESERGLLERYVPDVMKKTPEDLFYDQLAPLYIHKLVPDLYDVTYRLGKIVLSNNACGIRYASAFAPLELSGTPVVVTLAGSQNGNYALTEKGYSNLEFISAERKMCHNEFKLDTFIEEVGKVQKENQILGR